MKNLVTVRRLSKGLIVGLLAFVYGSLHAIEFYVSPDGNDGNAGTKESPVATFACAVEKVHSHAGKKAVSIHFEDGVYYLPETIIFAPEDSGTKKHPVVYQAVNEGGVVLSGGSELKLVWKAHKNGVFKAQTPEGLTIDQLFINGENQRMARYPNYDADKKTEAYQGYAADAFSTQRAEGWAEPSGGYIHAMHAKRWGGYHYRITGKNAEGEILYEGGWQNNRQLGMHKDFRMVENIFEELDAAGEWYHDASANILYYKPGNGFDLNTAKVEVVRLRNLIEFQGSESSPVKHITLKGFVVRHAARTFMDSREPLLRSDWAIYRGGSFMLTGTEGIQILDTEFDQVGGNAIFVNKYNRNVLIKGCHIHDTGASGVCFVGDPGAVRDPLFEYHETNDLSKIDRNPGPKTNNYPADSVVEDCLIHGIGRVERQPAGVQISMAQGITVRDVSIYDCARAGINISEGTWGGHLIERCDVFDTVLETHDHGSFNSWGRDRFWHKDRSLSQLEIDADPEMPFLDAMKTTTIRNSRWRCDHGWDIDLDDGSSNYDIYNNLMLNNGLKFREGFRRHAWNNITVNNGFHPHVWYDGSKDQVYSNIFMSRHRPARMKKKYTDGTRVDGNLYAESRERVMEISDMRGWDDNSVFGDPMFVDPENGDFRVKQGSPALKIGFRNFPMDQFGVKKPSLKAIARTPEIPQPRTTQIRADGKTAKMMNWLGATLTELSGEEFSAYGVSKEESGIAVSEISPISPAKKIGLMNGDLIQSVNGQKTSGIELFRKAIQGVKGKATFGIVRNQQRMEIAVEIATTTSEQQRVIHPYWAPKTWEIRPDDITTIMGFRAELSGNLNHADRPTPTVVNNAFIRGFDSENDKMTWEMEVPYDANYSVALLYTGSNEILSQSTLELSSGVTTIVEKAIVPNWETRPVVPRHNLKQTLFLKKGINQVSFRLVDFQGTQAERDSLKLQTNEKGKTNPFALWSIELVRPEALTAMKARAKSMKADVQWMVDGKYGLFVHFSSLSVPFHGGPTLGEQYQKLVDAFDVDAFVEKVVETGASWVCFTCAHGTQHWPGPSKTIDQIKSGFTCERDLIRELIDGLGQHNIRLMLYYNPNSGIEDLYGPTYGNGDTPDPSGYFNFLESHFREVSLRYGEDLATTAGYIDGSGWKVYQLDPPWEKLAKAIKAGNPNAPVGFSQNLFANLTPFSDLVVSDGSGRVPEIQPSFLFEEGGQLEGQYPASWFYMDGWSSRTGNGVFTAKPKFSAEQYLEIFKRADEANMPITINLAMTPDVTTEHPFFNPECIDIMKQVRKAVKGY